MSVVQLNVPSYLLTHFYFGLEAMINLILVPHFLSRLFHILKLFILLDLQKGPKNLKTNLPKSISKVCII